MDIGALPPSTQRAREVLLELGPLPPETLVANLAREGIRMSRSLLVDLPARYPGRFFVQPDGRLSGTPGPVTATVGGAEGAAVSVPLAADGAPWRRARVEPLSLDRVVALDIETTGLDLQHDEIWEIGAFNVGTGATFHASVEISPELVDRVPVATAVGIVPLLHALSGLDEFLAGAALLVGQNVEAFDLRFLTAESTRQGSPWVARLPAVDLLELSVLVAPDLPRRNLAHLCARYGVVNGEPHRAVSDARATAAVMRAMLEEVEPSDPNWALTVLCLTAGNHPVAALLPPVQPPELDEALLPADDPLCAGVSIDDAPRTAREAVFFGFRRLPEVDPAFRDRRSQREMSDAVALVLDEGGRLAVEAPTGTGKSLAYLLAAAGRAQRGRPVLVATATKVLQTQLRRDALRLREQGLLPVPVRQIQGVSNYVCTRELADAIDGTDPGGREWTALAVAVRALGASATGVWDDVTDWVLRSRDPVYRVTREAIRTDAQGCEKQDCAWRAACPLLLRLEGIERHPGVVVANHALVGAWVNARMAGASAAGDILDAADLIFDEAHELEDTLTKAWTERLGEVELRGTLRVLTARRGPVRAARHAARVAGTRLTSLEPMSGVADAYRDAAERLGDTVRAYVHEFGGVGRTAVLTAGIVRPRAEYRAVRAAAFEVTHASRRLREMLTAVDGEVASLGGGGRSDGGIRRAVRTARFRLAAAVARLESQEAQLEGLRELTDEHLLVHLLRQDRPPDDHDAGTGEWSYDRAPIHIGDRFASHVSDPAHSVVLTSATLAVGGTFDFLSERLGIRTVSGGGAGDDGYRGMRLDSPFDYASQSAVVLTSHLPLPVPGSEREFVEDMAADQAGFLSLSRGRALVLFAARARMEAVTAAVRRWESQLAERGVSIVAQGEHNPAEIVERFRSDPGTVAYGLRSYWQGFDAPGETLTYLIVEKPPYPHPDDPVTAARQRAIADRGGDPFLDYVVPKTAILFAQGFGRLIRHEEDRGVAIICDRRMQSPTTANRMLLGTLPGQPGLTVHYAEDRADAWSFALRFATGAEPDLSQALVTGVDEVSGLLDALRLEPGEEPTEKLRSAARELFGIEALRPAQLELMRAFLAGRDALGLLPTGSGKSLCFQLPALLTPRDGATVVVSPLVALIKDQVDDLRSRRGLRPVQGITSGTTGTMRTEILRDLADGRVRLLYVSPERLVRDPILRRALRRQQLTGLVVDEAHCVSVWGHDFRPEFRQIAAAVKSFPPAPRLGLTATATPEVERDITAELGLTGPLVVREPTDRPNLRFRVERCPDERARARALLRIVAHVGDRPGIIYTGRRATSEEVAALLRRALVSARHYHAGMVPEQREAVQDDFFSGSTRVVVATKAFGMGINKPDIGWVVHYDLPESLDGYAQEAGRAARAPGLVGECVLLWTDNDVARRRRQLGKRTVGDDLALTERTLALISQSRPRGDSLVFDPEATADELDTGMDDLNVVLAWLERAGTLERLEDCSSRGMVQIGLREPEEETERRRFRTLFATTLKGQPEVRRMVDFPRLEDTEGLDPDQLEEDLVAWSLDRLVTFSSTARLWRVRLSGRAFRPAEHRATVARWREWQRHRLEAVIDYAASGRCRRQVIADHFSDTVAPCAPAVQACDRCDPSPAPWSAVPDQLVPDPESLVDVTLVTLQAVAWASGFVGGRYGEVGLKAAILGRESLGPSRPLGAGLLNCPQFGALRYVRGAEGELDRKIGELVTKGLVGRERVSRDGGAGYSTLVLTETGQRVLGVRRV